MFGIQLTELDSRNSVVLRSAGTGHPLLIFPGMEGSGESCLQVVADALDRLDFLNNFQVILIDYSDESHSSLEDLTDTIVELLLRTLHDRSLTIWGQSFGNLLGVIAGESPNIRVDNFLMVSAFDSLPEIKVTLESLSGKFTPPILYRNTIKPVGRYIFGPCGDQREHPFFDALERAPGTTFARRTSWLAHRSFADVFARAKYQAHVWLGSRDRLIDRDRQISLFQKLAKNANYSLHMIPGSGHVVLPSRCVTWLAKEIARILKTNLDH